MIPGKQYTPEVLLSIAWRRKWLIAIPAVLIASTVAAVTHYLPNRYQSDTLIIVEPQKVPETYVRAMTTTRIEDRLNSITQQIMSRTRLEQIIKDFNLYPERTKTQIMEDIVEDMRDDIDVEIVKGDAFRVKFTAGDPLTAMRVTEKLGTFFIDESMKDREYLAEGTSQFLETQLNDARRKLEDNEKKLVDYRRSHDGELPTQLEANLQGLSSTHLQLQNLANTLAQYQDRRLNLERVINDPLNNIELTPTAPVAPPPQPVGPTAADRLQAAQAQLRAMELKFKPEHPDIVAMRRTINELQEAADAEAALLPVGATPRVNTAEQARVARLADARAELAKLDRDIEAKLADDKRLHQQLAEYQRRIEAAPTRESELTGLMRDYTTMQGIYTSTLAKQQESQMSANLERRQIGEQFKILDQARLPQKPSSPNRPRLYLLGVAAALAIGLACAAGVEYFDRTLRSEDDVKLALNLPVLATIPLLRPKSGNRHVKAAVAASVSVAVITGAAAVAWRLLR